MSQASFLNLPLPYIPAAHVGIMNFNVIGKLKGFISNSRHVLSVSYKPSTEAFMRTMKVVLLGTILLGIVGFAISIIITFITS